MSVLPFVRITAHDAAQQRQRMAEKLAAERPFHPPLPAPPKRAPGRPPKKRPLECAATIEEAGIAHKDSPPKRAHTNWFSSPYIADILQAYARNGFHARKTILSLQRTAKNLISLNLITKQMKRTTNATFRSLFQTGRSRLELVCARSSSALACAAPQELCLAPLMSRWRSQARSLTPTQMVWSNSFIQINHRLRYLFSGWS
jgi:hypothetical protein